MSKPFDGAEFGRQMVDAVKAHLQPLKDALDAAKAENVALRARIEALEGRAAVPGPMGPQGEAGADGAPGLDGRDGAPGPAGPAGERGIEGKAGPQGEQGPAGIAGLDGKDGAPGRDGADGAPGLDGKDGAPGRDGKPGERGQAGERGEKGLDGKDGRDGLPGVQGRDGKDGLGFDDLHVEHDGARTITFRLARGERTKEFTFKVPVVIDAGVWREGSEYEPGDGVTWRGSYWIAQKGTTAKPDDGNADWRLAVKKGRDGKDAVRTVGAS
jgi:integrin beta 3